MRESWVQIQLKMLVQFTDASRRRLDRIRKAELKRRTSLREASLYASAIYTAFSCSRTFHCSFLGNSAHLDLERFTPNPSVYITNSVRHSRKKSPSSCQT